MQKKIVIAALVLVIAVAGWLAYYFSDKEVIKRQLGGLAVELGKEGQETPLQMALKMGQVKNMLAASCQVTIPERRYAEALEQELIIRYLIFHRSRYASIAVTFADLVVDVPAKGEAVVQSTVRLSRQKANEAEASQEVEPVEIVLAQGAKKWLIQAVTMPEALVD